MLSKRINSTALGAYVDLKFLSAIAECFMRLSHGLGVCLSIRPTLALYQNGDT